MASNNSTPIELLNTGLERGVKTRRLPLNNRFQSQPSLYLTQYEKPLANAETTNQRYRPTPESCSYADGLSALHSIGWTPTVT